MIHVEEKVSELEEIVKKLAYMQVNTQISIDRMSNNIDKLSQEMKDYKTHTQETLDKLSQRLEQDTQKLKAEMNSQWRKVVKKLGTLVEDMVIPNVEFIAEKYFNLTQGKIYPRPKLYSSLDNSKQREFDAIAVYPDKVIWVEAKHNPKPEYATEFIDLVKSNEFFEYSPEYADKEVIPIFASIYIPDNVLKHLSKNKIYAMAMREDTMDIVNFGEF